MCAQVKKTMEYFDRMWDTILIQGVNIGSVFCSILSGNCTCRAQGDIHVFMYDGLKVSNQGNCTYRLVGLDCEGCNYFTVDVKSSHTSPGISKVEKVTITPDGGGEDKIVLDMDSATVSE